MNGNGCHCDTLVTQQLKSAVATPLQQSFQLSGTFNDLLKEGFRGVQRAKFNTIMDAELKIYLALLTGGGIFLAYGIRPK